MRSVMKLAFNPFPPKFVYGSQIRAARALLGWRRADLASAAGLHRNAVGYWERRERHPRREPVACKKMRAALLQAGVVTVSTPAPGVCILPREQREAGAQRIGASETRGPLSLAIPTAQETPC